LAAVKLGRLNFAISAETIRVATAKSAQPWLTDSAASTQSAAGNSAEGYFNRALQEVNSGNYRSGITDYTEAIRLKAGWAEAYRESGHRLF